MALAWSQILDKSLYDRHRKISTIEGSPNNKSQRTKRFSQPADRMRRSPF
jgi:hypothetical protein